MEELRDVVQYLAAVDTELATKDAEILRLHPQLLSLEAKLSLFQVQLASVQQEADTLRLHAANVVKLERENANLCQKLAEVLATQSSETERLKHELCTVQQSLVAAQAQLVADRSAAERERRTHSTELARIEGELRDLRTEHERTNLVVSTLNQNHSAVLEMNKNEISRLEKHVEEKRREINALKRDHAVQLQQAEERYQKTCSSFEERLLRSSGQGGREGQVIESLKVKLASQRREYEQELATARATINSLRGGQVDRKRRDVG